MDQKDRPRKQDPLHGVTLKMVVTELVEKYGWQKLGSQINIKCFTIDPSIQSSLKFLRKTPWAREKVEALYLSTNTSESTNTGESVWDSAKRNRED